MSHISKTNINVPIPPPSEPVDFVTNNGTANPIADTLMLLASHNITTSGAGNTVTITDNNSHIVGDLVPLSPGVNALTIDTGRIFISEGSLRLPATTSDSNEGVITHGAQNVLHTYPTANSNLFYGIDSGNFTNSGSFNIGIGNEALSSITTSDYSIAIGFESGMSLLSGNDNIFVGHQSGTQLTTGSNNIGIGAESLCIPGVSGVTTGSHNIAIGYKAGSEYIGSDSSNIAIGNIGQSGESNTIRIGTQGTGSGQQNRCFIRGVNVTPSGSDILTLTVNPDGQLGTVAPFQQESLFDVELAANENVTTVFHAVGSSSGYTINTNIGGDFSGFTYTLPKAGWYFFTLNLALSQLVLTTANRAVSGFWGTGTGMGTLSSNRVSPTLVKTPDNETVLRFDFIRVGDAGDTIFATSDVRFNFAASNHTLLAEKTWFSGYYFGP